MDEGDCVWRIVESLLDGEVVSVSWQVETVSVSVDDNVDLDKLFVIGLTVEVVLVLTKVGLVDGNGFLMDLFVLYALRDICRSLFLEK